MTGFVLKTHNNSIEETNDLLNKHLLEKIKIFITRSTLLPLFDKYTFDSSKNLEDIYNDFFKEKKNEYHSLLYISYVLYEGQWYGYLFTENSKLEVLIAEIDDIEMIGRYTNLYQVISTNVLMNYNIPKDNCIHKFKLLENPLDFNEFNYILSKESIIEDDEIRLKLLTRYFINKEIKQAKPHVNKFSLAIDFLSKYENYKETDFLTNYPNVYEDFNNELIEFLKVKTK